MSQFDERAETGSCTGRTGCTGCTAATAKAWKTCAPGSASLTLELIGAAGVTHTLTPYQGQVGFDFLGFGIRQELIEKANSTQEHTLGATITSLMHWFAPQEPAPQVKTLITPSQEANRRHLAAIEQRLQRLQTASQAKVIEELNPLITGWVAYYNGVVPTATMNHYDDLVEQQLLTWAGKLHPGQARYWLFARYWRPIGNRKRVFATANGVQLRTYQQTSILKG